MEKGSLVHGNPINRSGRPKGSKSINSAASIKRLEELGFDPLEHLVQQHAAVDLKIRDMMSGKTKYSAIAVSNLESLKKSIAETLMRYAYKAVPTAATNDVEQKSPLKITLDLGTGGKGDANGA